MTPEQRTLLSEAMRDLDVIRVDTPQAELLIRAREHVAAALEPEQLPEKWPDFVEGDL